MALVYKSLQHLTFIVFSLYFKHILITKEIRINYFRPKSKLLHIFAVYY
jgi:hypothetical protein